MIKKLLMALVLMPMMGLAGSYTVSNTAADLGTISFPATISGTLLNILSTTDGYTETITFKPSVSGSYRVSTTLTLDFGEVHTIKTTIYQGTINELSSWNGSGSATITFSSSNYYTIKLQMISPSYYTTTRYSYVATIGESAPTTYTVTYKPGSSGTGSQQTATKTKGTALTLEGAIFTRMGYTQTGWSTSDGGSKAYNLSGSYATDASIMLYPYWTANGAPDLTFVQPSGWSDKLVISTTTGTSVDATTFTTADKLYLDFSVKNVGNEYSSSVYVDIYVDGVKVDYWPYSAGLAANQSYTWTDKSIEALSAGTHTIKVQIRDDANETNTSNNTYAKTITVSAPAPTTYTITYSPGADGTGAQQTATKTKGVALTLKGAIFTRKGYVQDGWTTADGDLYRLGDSFSGNISMTFYPLWEPNKYSVSYVLNGGAFVSDGNQQEMHPDLVLFGDSFAVSPIERTGFVFTGWTVTSGLDSSTAKWLVAQKKVGGISQNALLNPYEEHGIDSVFKLCSPDDDGFVRFKNLTPVANGSVTLTANWTKSQFSADDLNFVLSQGWTWVSVNVQPSDASFASVFKGISFADDDVIKSSGGSATYYGGTWYPSPATFVFVPGRAYAVKKSTAGAATVTVNGTPAVPSLTVMSGWNWIGPTTDMPVSLDALKHSGSFADDDVISSTSRSSTYYGGKWYGSLQSLEPGVGYKARFSNVGTISIKSNE